MKLIEITLFSGLLGFIIFSSIQGAMSSTLPTDSITLTWDRDFVLEYTIVVDSRAKQNISGRSDSAMIEVSHGKHCFSLLKKTSIIRPSKPVCLKTRDSMEIHIPFDEPYI